MATGAVAVATDVGGCRELITHGESGVLVAPGDVEAVAGAILEVLGSEEVARRLATAARRRIESEFAVEAMVEKTLAVYDACLSQKGLVSGSAVAAA